MSRDLLFMAVGVGLAAGALWALSPDVRESLSDTSGQPEEIPEPPLLGLAGYHATVQTEGGRARFVIGLGYTMSGEAVLVLGISPVGVEAILSQDPALEQLGIDQLFAEGLKRDVEGLGAERGTDLPAALIGVARSGPVGAVLLWPDGLSEEAPGTTGGLQDADAWAFLLPATYQWILAHGVKVEAREIGPITESLRAQARYGAAHRPLPSLRSLAVHLSQWVPGD